ncbi:MAG: bifunctional metallophosphatase/5'-nucleotidase [Methanobacteriota archaeon]|nr:MAG: bifunctional metallophosphatase/5'-nucleotidase [Euryarchaeota archaeon]
MATERFTILHSNDMHGDFLSEARSEGKGHLIGGLARLSGYINTVRKEEKNVFYVISGDMLQGSLIDSEYKGISTIEIMNYLAPDVASLGNHELDYGLPHLLFLEKMANFPIVNANMYIKKYYKRLMMPHVILQKAGFSILFIGIITEKVMDSLASDRLVGSFVSLEEASREVGKITDAYKNDDIDLTVLLTHIGIDADIELAGILKPEWGVDMIIGGHSHTILAEPIKVNSILIVQAGVGTDHIGRFDITVDDATNAIIDHQWRLVDIDEDTAAEDAALVAYIRSYQDVVDRKYNTLLCKFARQLTHPAREEETEIGNLFADACAEIAECDVMLLGSGSIRNERMGPLVTLGAFRSCFPYDDTLVRFVVTGDQLVRIFQHIMRKENRNGEGECYQVNHGVRAVYNDREARLEALMVNDQPVTPAEEYRLALTGYHLNNCSANLNIHKEDLMALRGAKVVSTSTSSALEEYLRNHQNAAAAIEGRLQYRQA